MRLFFGIDLPEPLRSEVGRVQSLLRPAGADVRWVNPAGAHLTLKFLGEVEPDRVGAIDEAVSTLATPPPFRLGIRGLGTFPRKRAPRVIWAGATGPTDALETLHAGLESALAAIGFEPERRAFHPHVTLGRLHGRRPERELRRLIGDNADEEIGRWTVRRFVLFESRPGRSGPRYEIAGRYPLG